MTQLIPMGHKNRGATILEGQETMHLQNKDHRMRKSQGDWKETSMEPINADMRSKVNDNCEKKFQAFKTQDYTDKRKI